MGLYAFPLRNTLEKLCYRDMRCIFLLLIFCANLAHAEPVAYRLVEDKSRVGFTWFFGESAIKGDMPVSRADITLDFDRPSNSRVLVSVNAAKARAGAALAGEAMKGQSVLWTDRFPEIAFQSEKVRRDGSGGAIMSGTLTVRGQTQPQEFRARLFRPKGTKAGNRDQLTIRLEGSLSRSAFGADGFANMVGDEVILDIQAFIVSDR